MADTLVHRGPDDQGIWSDASTSVVLAHRRLSILDLSPEGHQPMQSADGRWVLTFNGEIYNHGALRTELAKAGHLFRGHSDTEVMLAAFSEWGLGRALSCFNGMFAFAAWDRSERTLYLARDRLGEKPLYYAWLNEGLIFASELKALRAHPAFKASISRDAMALFLRHNYIPAPYTIYEGVSKLPAGTVLAAKAAPAEAAPASYWSVGAVVRAGAERPLEGSDEDAIEAVDAALREAVRLRMHADVPVGAFLSGGVDSSAVVALMQRQSARPVRTFSIGFGEQPYNEAEAAAAVARHIGTQHEELYVTPATAQAVIPRLPTIYDEPFADSSQIPTILVAQLARAQVTVSLSGDGGDEVFGGYERYFLGRSIWNVAGRVPWAARRLGAGVLAAIPDSAHGSTAGMLSALLPKCLGSRLRAGQLSRAAEVLRFRSFGRFYRDLVSIWKQPTQIVVGSQEPSTMLERVADEAGERSLYEQMMFWDTVTYLPDDILVKVDRASMAVSLEARVPLLDHNLVELAWRLPSRKKVRDGVGKWILRQVLYRYVPRLLIERPKQGFAMPINEWLREPLREWACDLLAPARLRREGFFDAAAVGKTLQDHLEGRRDESFRLWTLLMFQAWMDAARTPLAVSGFERRIGPLA